jgi:hypothetical protein
MFLIADEKTKDFKLPEFNFFLNKILIRYCHSQKFELYHTPK